VTSRGRAPIAALLLLALASAGCGMVTLKGRVATAATPMPTGRVLVVARFPAEVNRPIVESAEELLLRALRGTGDAVGGEQWLRHAVAAGAWWPAARLLEILRYGGSPVVDDTAIALEQLGVNGVIVVDVPTYEQIWGRKAKFTRVAVEAEAFQLSTRTSLWRVRGAAEVEERRGRAFQYALEQAVQVVVDGVRPSTRTTLGDLHDMYRDWRR
jgi:hypothetical protein